MADDNYQFAVYFNNEYIGTAEGFKIKKGSRFTMPLLEIKGKLEVVARK